MMRRPGDVWYENCKRCEGTGHILQDETANAGVNRLMDCPNCEGKGFVKAWILSTERKTKGSE